MLYHTMSNIIHNLLLIEYLVIIFLDIREEAIDSRAEVKSFDHSKLKHVETQEKNPLPTPQSMYSFACLLINQSF